MASVEQTLSQINSVLKKSKNGPYKNYSCKTVSWDDVQRGTVGGQLSCWGSNITDTRLYAKDGRKLFTVRGDNWNERLGKVTADDIALIATDENGGAGLTGLRPVTLRTVLHNIQEYGSYANLNNALSSLADDELDDEISVRFQTTFLPVEAGEKTSLEFAPEAYNYNTTDDADPRNLIFLCTTQGLAIQQDGQGAKKLFHHVTGDDGVVKRYWLEAESSSHKVGGSQVESHEERKDALDRGKATSTVIGTKSMGSRFNVLMTIQVPLKQKEKEIMMSSGCATCLCEDECYEEAEESEECYGGLVFKSAFCSPVYKRRLEKASPFGVSSAARVSRGSEVDVWDGLTVDDPKRHPNEHITATIVMYYTCSGGVPSTEDVKAAIDDLETLYQSIEVNGNLSDDKFNFMKSELTVKDVIDIHTKVTTQPPPKPSLPENAFVYPS